MTSLAGGISGRVDDKTRRTTTKTAATLLQSSESSDNGRPDRASAGAAHQACHGSRYCLQDAAHQTPPNAAPNCRFLSLLLLLLLLLLLHQTRWPCNERQQRRTRLPFTATYAPTGLPVSASHRCRRSTATVPCYCIRAQRQTSKRLIRDEMRDVTGTETMRWRSILCWQRGVQSPRGSSSLECTHRLRIRDYRL